MRAEFVSARHQETATGIARRARTFDGNAERPSDVVVDGRWKDAVR
jgi:hypothetical protein